MKKIMFFIPRMGGGGAERVIANLANEFDRRGNEVCIYTPTDDKSYYMLNDSVKIYGENFKVSKNIVLRPILLGINGIRLWFAYAMKIKTEKPDVVISFLTETNIIAQLHTHKDYKLIVSERNDPTRRNKLIQHIVKKLYPKADVLVCQSAKVAAFFHSANTAIIANPVDSEILPEPFYGTRRKTVVSVGRLMEQKNYANLIKAFSMLPDKLSEYTLEIYGEGVLRTELEQLINSLHLTNRVMLMGAKKDVLERIKDASLFVMSSDFEGYPNALAEAMAIGLPVISTDFYTGTARELIEEKNGLLVPVGDSRKLAVAMEELLADEKRRAAMSAENRKICDKLSIGKIADMWEKIL